MMDLLRFRALVRRDIECPLCLAQLGDPCVDINYSPGRPEITEVHDARTLMWFQFRTTAANRALMVNEVGN